VGGLRPVIRDGRPIVEAVARNLIVATGPQPKGDSPGSSRGDAGRVSHLVNNSYCMRREEGG